MAPQIGPDAAWHNAETFVESFYQNINAAVVDRRSESVRQVLEAVQDGGSPPGCPDIIDAFEASVLIQFIDAAAVEGLWRTATDVRRERTL